MLNSRSLEFIHLAWLKHYPHQTAALHISIPPGAWQPPLTLCFSEFDSFVLFCAKLSEKAMAPHSSTPAWKIPWTEKPGGLQSMGSWRVRYDWVTSLSLFTFMHWRRQWQPPPVFLPGGLHRVGHDWNDLAAAAVLSCFRHVQLCDPMDCSPPGSSVHGILQARTLEWVSVCSSRDQTHVSYISCIGKWVLYH